MRSGLFGSLAALLTGAGLALAQAPATSEPSLGHGLESARLRGGDVSDSALALPDDAPPAGQGAAVAAPADPPMPPAAPTAANREAYLAEIKNLRQQQIALEAKPQDDEQKKKIELLQKEVETLEKMVRLLADQLQKQTATLEARSLQAARRDQELAAAVDDLREQSDARERNGPV